MTLSVRVKLDGEVIYETWALNEATVEKASRERSLEVAVEVDGRPLSHVRLRRHRHVHARPARPPTRSPPAVRWSGRAWRPC